LPQDRKGAKMADTGRQWTAKTLNDIKQILEAQEDCLVTEYGGNAIGVFGSCVRGEQRHDSDVYLLIELERPPCITLIGLIELTHDWSDLC
jgi:predicted nucleotidyltransferase